jgi:hypothetical protein
MAVPVLANVLGDVSADHHASGLTSVDNARKSLVAGGHDVRVL